MTKESGPCSETHGRGRHSHLPVLEGTYSRTSSDTKGHRSKDAVQNPHTSLLCINNEAENAVLLQDSKQEKSLCSVLVSSLLFVFLKIQS